MQRGAAQQNGEQRPLREQRTRQGNKQRHPRRQLTHGESRSDMDSLARPKTTDVCHIDDHWRFTIPPLVKKHITSNHNTRTIGRTDDAAATIIAGLENHYANGRRSNNRRRKRRGQIPTIDIPPEKLPLRGASAATDVLDKDTRRLLISVGADTIKKICKPEYTVYIGDPMN